MLKSFLVLSAQSHTRSIAMVVAILSNFIFLFFCTKIIINFDSLRLAAIIKHQISNVVVQLFHTDKVQRENLKFCNHVHKRVEF